MEPFGLSIDIGVNKKKLPSILVYRKLLGRIRARVPEMGKHWASPDTLLKAEYFGLKFDLIFGQIKRPVARFYRWKRDGWKLRRNWGNPWTSGDHWFVLNSFVPVPAFFFSLYFKIKDKYPGLYLGFKTYRVDWISNPTHNWTGPEDENKKFLAPSATARINLWA